MRALAVSFVPAPNLRAKEAHELAFTRGLYPGTDDSGAFTRLVILQLTDGERGGLDVDVDAIKQRAADPRPAFGYL